MLFFVGLWFLGMFREGEEEERRGERRIGILNQTPEDSSSVIDT